jgi:hypothetical protein
MIPLVSAGVAGLFCRLIARRAGVGLWAAWAAAFGAALAAMMLPGGNAAIDPAATVWPLEVARAVTGTAAGALGGAFMVMLSRLARHVR